ncbi:MAG: hemerythrin domain-containing protein [Planctomycetes bacterium]|nr:hemerythrin domain-containing protein [Planctomycetota bacterium]
MPILSPFFTSDHRSCDELLATVETDAQAKQWPQASTAWSRFEAMMRCHFEREEELLFPAFEQATGNTQGPTAMMRMEHDQMRGLLDQLDAAVRAEDGRRFLDLSESLMLLIQQHNMKEEQILYPMCDEVVADQAALLERIEARVPNAS